MPYLCLFTCTYREFPLLHLCSQAWATKYKWMEPLSASFSQYFSGTIISSAKNAFSSSLCYRHCSNIEGRITWTCQRWPAWPWTSDWFSGTQFPYLLIGQKILDQLITKKLPALTWNDILKSFPRLPFSRQPLLKGGHTLLWTTRVTGFREQNICARSRRAEADSINDSSVSEDEDIN